MHSMASSGAPSPSSAGGSCCLASALLSLSGCLLRASWSCFCKLATFCFSARRSCISRLLVVGHGFRSCCLADCPRLLDWLRSLCWLRPLCWLRSFGGGLSGSTLALGARRSPHPLLLQRSRWPLFFQSQHVHCHQRGSLQLLLLLLAALALLRPTAPRCPARLCPRPPMLEEWCVVSKRSALATADTRSLAALRCFRSLRCLAPSPRWLRMPVAGGDTLG